MRFSTRSTLSILLSLAALAILAGGFLVAGAVHGNKAHAAPSAVGNPFTFQITSSGTTSFTQAPQGHDGVKSPEINTAQAGTFGHAAVKSNAKTANGPTV